MSEAMTAESIIEAEWLLRGYWTRVRYPYQTPKSGWSDIDVVSYDPQKQHLVISESKVQGPKRTLYAYGEAAREKFTKVNKFLPGYFSFINALKLITANGLLFEDYALMVKATTVQLVSNMIIDPGFKPKVLEEVKALAAKECPHLTKLEVQIDTTIEVLARVIEAEARHPQGRRYGNATLDIARELNRYLDPAILHAGKQKPVLDALRNIAISPLLDALYAQPKPR
ncbi:MAG: hypothetical protein KF778_09655 [Rhodocyclaceae bacterium]|nr:hypothetical protein [Rhodocyclaceae bacterium]MBX3668654.1 hypothetical protein [Rhodocyclaceae bacterium]